MVRPQYRPPRHRSRSYEDGSGFGGHRSHSPASKGRRDTSSFHGNTVIPWRESRGRGRAAPGRRGPPPGEHRFTHWRGHGHDNYSHYPDKMEQQSRRPGPPRPPHHHSHSPSRGHHSQRGHSFHRHPPVHRSPPPRNFRTHPADRHTGLAPNYRGSYRGPRGRGGYQHQDPHREEHRGPREEHHVHHRGPREDSGPRQRPYGHMGQGMKRWNAERPFPHQQNGERRSPRGGPLGGPGSVQSSERWLGEQESRRQRAAVPERQSSRSLSGEREPDGPRPPPYRTPSWRGGAFHRNPQDRLTAAGPRKRRIDASASDSTPPLHGPVKLLRRERPMIASGRPYGGKPLSLREKSQLVKNQQLRAQSLLKLRIPPFNRPRPFPGSGALSSVLALRKKRFQLNAAPLRHLEPNREKQPSPPTEKKEAASSSRDSDQVESRRHASRPNRSSDLENGDLVVLSHWSLAPSSKEPSSPPKDAAASSSSESSDEDGSPTRRTSKTSKTRSSPEEQRRGPPDRRSFRQFDETRGGHRSWRPFRRPAVMQRPRLMGSAPHRPFHDPNNNSRRPLMENLVPRPFPNQRVGFRKSYSIMFKYRNLRASRQRAPFSRGAPPPHRW